MKMMNRKKSKNIEDRRKSPSEMKTSRVKYHKAGDPHEAGMQSVVKMLEVESGLSDFPEKKKNEYKTTGKKNTRGNGTVPVPEDKPKRVNAGASNPATQKWKGK